MQEYNHRIILILFINILCKCRDRAHGIVTTDIWSRLPKDAVGFLPLSVLPSNMDNFQKDKFVFNLQDAVLEARTAV